VRHNPPRVKNIAAECFLWALRMFSRQGIHSNLGIFPQAGLVERLWRRRKPPGNTGVFQYKKMVAGPRIELGTQGFSVLCSTN
jgi:hypothetical protein